MRRVGIAELKARLSEYLKTVRRGATVTVVDRDTPVAQIVPFDADQLQVRRAIRQPRDLRLPPRPARSTNSLAVLLGDRSRR